MLAADFDDYHKTQRKIEQLWMSGSDWTGVSIRNIANMAWFSSDRTISEYARDIWDVPVTPPAQQSGR
jgi:starch phosphorylase